MASNQLVALAIVAIVLPTVAVATDFIVGDDQGWKVGVNYTQWAEGKAFRVGDNLVFKYQPPHNVLKVDGAAFKACNTTGNALTTGNDTIPLTQPGKRWYICGVADHCVQGQKLVINVESDGPIPAPAPVPEPAPVPAPGPAPKSNDSCRFLSSWYQIFVAAAVVMAMIAI